MPYRLSLSAMAVSFGFCTLALAQQPAGEAQRQLGAHAHGTGNLSIAIERTSVEMELEVPASDIVGFEHAAKTPEQKKAVAAATAVLSKPLNLIKFPEAAGCRLASAKVKLEGGDAHDHDHAHGKAETSKAEPASHAEFHAEYKLTCTKPDLVQALGMTDYFKAFPAAAALEVSVIGDKGQAKVKATREKPRVDLKPTG